MKYVYNGSYRTFMGRTFAFGKPVEINDSATLEAIRRDPTFIKVAEETKVEQKPAVLPDECPKCGKVVKRGKVMHQKHCKGK